MIIWVLLVGLVVGAIAKLLMPGNDPGGVIMTMLLGVAGAVFANWLGAVFGIYHYGEGSGLIASVLGAMLILWAYRSFSHRRLSSHH